MGKNFKSWPKGWPKRQNYPEIPVYHFLKQTAERIPNRIAIVFGGLELTYAELKILADRFANALADLGVKKSDRVVIHSINCPQFAIAYYGILKIGAIYSPLSPLSSPREAAYQLNDCGAETLISLDMFYSGISPIIPETKIKRVITTSIADTFSPIISPLKPIEKISIPDTLDMAELLKKYEPHTALVDINPKKDLAHIAYTGGTTGLPKGVMITHFNAVTNVLQLGCWASGAKIEMEDGNIKQEYPPGVDPEKDILLPPDQGISMVAVPWFHGMGITGYLNLLIFGGATMIVLPRFDPKEYLDAIVKYKANSIGGAPQLFIPILNHPDFNSYDLSSVKSAVSGAAPLAMPILQKMLNSFPGVVVEGYGLTETTMAVTANPYDREAIKQGSIGIPIFDTELKVVDVVTGEDMPPGSEGEICAKGPQIMAGYWNKPDETANTLKNGWVHTGDIGREDEDGFFYITDRKKDMIIYKGYNVYPRELENVIFEHPAVAQCAVIGKPDMDVGELPVAFVELKPGVSVTKEEIIEHTNLQVAKYKKLSDVVFVVQIPVSAAGKILKRQLRDQFKL